MGVGMRKLLRSRVIVVFGATNRIGRATISVLTATASTTVVAVVENPADPRVEHLKKTTNCFVAKCDFANQMSIQHVLRHAEAVLLIPAPTERGSHLARRVIDAMVAHSRDPRLVLVSSLLAADDFWRREAQAASTVGYAAVEAHARATLPAEKVVVLRVPLLMECSMYCRDEVMYARRLMGCFAPTTPVPCIALQDVALAVSVVLTQTNKQHRAIYTLASEKLSCSPLEMTQMLSTALALPLPITYRQVPDDRFRALLKDHGAADYIAHSMIRLKNYLEIGMGLAPDLALTQPAAAGTEEASTGSSTRAALPLTRLAAGDDDYRVLMERAPMAPQQWLQANVARFQRSPQTDMQLFVVGSGESLFLEVERMLAQQVTAPTATTGMGEATIPSGAGLTPQSKVTFCTIKSAPGGGVRHLVNIPGQQASPISQLLHQLTTLDVVVLIPPLRLGLEDCLEIVHQIVDAARAANAWGIVFVSSVYTGDAVNERVLRMTELEQVVVRSGVPYVIARLPMFMEYFLALESESVRAKRSQSASGPPTGTRADTEPGPSPLEEEEGEGEEEEEKPSASASWMLLDRSLASSPQYLIATADAATVLVSMAFTFPLHRNKTRVLYTECRPMRKVEAVLQRYAHRGGRIDFAQVDALHEAREPERSFWQVAYWTHEHVKQFLEASVRLSGTGQLLEQSETYEEITEREPTTLETWAQRNSKGYTALLATGTRQRKEATATSKPDVSSFEQVEQEAEQRGGAAA